MTKSNSNTKTPFTDEEVAFLIAYADYCLYHEVSYRQTLAVKLKKISGHMRDWDKSLRPKIKSILKHYGRGAALKPADLAKQGIACLDIDKLEDEIASGVRAYRSEWELDAADAEDEVTSSDRTEPTLSDVADESVEENDSEKPTSASQRARVPQADDSPERASSPSRSTRMNAAKENDVDHISNSSASSRATSSVSENLPPSKASKKRTAETINGEEPPQKKKKKKHSEVLIRVNNKKRSAAVIDEQEQLSDSDGLEKDDPQPTTSTNPVDAQDKVDKPVSSSRPSLVSLRGQRAAKAIASSNQPENNLKIIPTPSTATIGQKRNAPAAHVNERTERQDLSTSDTDLSSRSKRRRIEAPKDAKRVKDIEGQVEKLTDQASMNLELTHWLVRRLLKTGEDMTTPENQHLRTIIRTIEREPNEFFDKLMGDLRSEQALKVRYRQGVRDMVGNLAMGHRFPKPPIEQEVQHNWQSFKDHIKWTVGRFVTIPTPSLTSAAFMRARIEDIAYGRVLEAQLQSCIEDLREFLVSPHAQQSLLSALFCRWVFANPEWMCKDMHSDASLAILRSIGLANPLMTVEHFDKAAFQLLTNDPDFRSRRIELRKHNFLRSFTEAASSFCTPREENDRTYKTSPNDFADTAIELKKTLMLAPSEYCIHHARPGMEFDSSWMIPYDDEHWEIKDGGAKGRTVSMCLFPALTSECLPDFEEDSVLEQALVKNKNFFPAFGEKAIHKEKEVVCKAYVLILDYK